MAEGVNGGPARFYRLRRSRSFGSEGRASHSRRGSAGQQDRPTDIEAETEGSKGECKEAFEPSTAIEGVAIGSGPPPSPTYKSRENDPNATRLAPV